ncbi:MAG: DoxX family protein [Gammaproteobacteria bacterium]|nr:DoxX family protein [Gammaproteobacteria bacterium]
MSLATSVSGLNQLLNQLQSPLLLVFRLYVAYVFFLSGLQKINNWDMTLTLFEYEYAVPLLPYDLAAYLATAGELFLPVMLVLGLGTRFFAIALSVLNIVAVISYYEALAKVGQVTPHIFWGALLLTNISFGAGLFSVDHWLKGRHRD